MYKCKQKILPLADFRGFLLNKFNLGKLVLGVASVEGASLFFDFSWSPPLGSD